ncbi:MULTISPECIES: type 4 pilus major pilin [unclassified Achromobacter]|uniref:type 4 pilus major pilin n=1 Tax=unclassified Achromobacter TaxID=2626865 RepID=UPI0009E99295|nr:MULTISPECIES: type 4 pilus major pilin [unclassified Achromobacter]
MNASSQSQHPRPKLATSSVYRLNSNLARRNPAAYRQLGQFSLAEVVIVVAITLLALVFGVPAVNGIVTEMRVPAVAGELQRFMARTKVLGESDNVTPYANITTVDNLIPALQGSSVFKVSTTTVAHRLGGSGTGSNGTITLAPAALGGGAMGSAFSLTLTNVNAKACPTLASTLAAVSETISVNGTAAKTLGSNNEPGTFDPATAQALCEKGDSNTFVFASR